MSFFGWLARFNLEGGQVDSFTSLFKELHFEPRQIVMKPLFEP
ncbi:MAG: hypothetical protein CFH41_02196 [Alphaproteobacteria bacterium MarineAlpha11_Bin1]|nr:MAG: hypothetical protein CFH41_02196 [Alphaproteobacteria bacterium MarineAlpha11_Bin1]